jgi:hypothetical protein
LENFNPPAADEGRGIKPLSAAGGLKLPGIIIIKLMAVEIIK